MRANFVDINGAIW